MLSFLPISDRSGPILRPIPLTTWHFAQVPVLGILPWLKDLDYAALRPGSLLSEFSDRIKIDDLLPRDDEY